MALNVNMKFIILCFTVTLVSATGPDCYRDKPGNTAAIVTDMMKRNDTWTKSLVIVPDRDGKWELKLLILVLPYTRLTQLDLHYDNGPITIRGRLQNRPISAVEAFPSSFSYFMANRPTSLDLRVTENRFLLEISFQETRRQWNERLSNPLDLTHTSEFHIWNGVNAEEFTISFDCAPTYEVFTSNVPFLTTAQDNKLMTTPAPVTDFGFSFDIPSQTTAQDNNLMTTPAPVTDFGK
ncbi:hypothetical protein SK128_004956 [Halocaridina rubra]|uniref:Galectin n=1 Tax=Halocaridina rubra TaxID=373956 RepID=A0AAN8ZWS7_HALRR